MKQRFGKGRFLKWFIQPGMKAVKENEDHATVCKRKESKRNCVRGRCPKIEYATVCARHVDPK